MNHNESVRGFSEATVDNSPSGSVLVRPCGMHHNNYFDETQGASTAVSVGDCGQPGGLVHNLRHNNVERPVQSPQRRTEPFDLHRHGAPLPLEAVALPLVHRPGQVEREAVTEVEPSPPHPEIVEPRTKTVGDVLRHAARIIEERGWQQGQYEDSTGAVCLAGALRQVTTARGPEYRLAKKAVRNVTGLFIFTFNDAPGRTAAEVIAALRAAADEADRG